MKISTTQKKRGTFCHRRPLTFSVVMLVDAHRAEGPGPKPKSQPPWVQAQEAESLGTYDVSVWKEPAEAGKEWCVPKRKVVQGHIRTELCVPPIHMPT